MKQVQITKDFGRKFRERTGLSPGSVHEVEPHKPPQRGQVWVKCPAVPQKIDEGFTMRSEGYCLLEPGEFRWA